MNEVTAVGILATVTWVSLGAGSVVLSGILLGLTVGVGVLAGYALVTGMGDDEE